jgi:hypothetical protein
MEADDELLSASTRTQRAFERAVVLAQEVDTAPAPAALIGLRDQATRTAQAFVEAGLAVSRWVSAPTLENQELVRQALAGARQALTNLEASEWIYGSR